MAQAAHQDLITHIDQHGIGWLTLNRVSKSNAFDANLIDELIHTITSLSNSKDLRALVLQSNGQHFSAGADLNWMRKMAAQSEQENLEDARQLAQLMHCLDTFPHPTLAFVHGCAFGGALGLICCCDIVFAAPETKFCLSEVKLGLVPATIGPYVCRAIGVRQARRYMLSAEIFDATTALNLDLVHEIAEPTTLTQLAMQISQHSPSALKQTKNLIRLCEPRPIDDALQDYTSQLIATVRASSDAKEGIDAFFNKRKPIWQREKDHD